MSFAEVPGVRQLDVENNLVLEYPTQLTPSVQSGTFDIEVIKGKNKYIVSGNTYEVINNKVVVKINKNDSYESCKKRMESKNNLSEYTANYVEELDKLSRLSWLFVSPEKEEKFKFPKGDFKNLYYSFRKDIKSIRSFHRKSRRTKRY